MTPDEKLLTPGEVAEILHLSPVTIGHMLRAGTLPGQKVGHMWRTRAADLDAYIIAGSEAAAAQRAAKAKKQEESAYAQAAARILATPELEPYREMILADWPEGDAHYTWAATCDLAELVSWAEAASPEKFSLLDGTRVSQGQATAEQWEARAAMQRAYANRGLEGAETVDAKTQAARAREGTQAKKQGGKP